MRDTLESFHFAFCKKGQALIFVFFPNQFLCGEIVVMSIVYLP